MARSIYRRDRLVAGLKDTFYDNPNRLFTHRVLLRRFDYAGNELYNGLKVLVDDGIINSVILSRHRYFWLKHPEGKNGR